MHTKLFFFFLIKGLYNFSFTSQLPKPYFVLVSLKINEKLHLCEFMKLVKI